MPRPSLEHLLVRSGSGDRSAFAELYDRLAPRVFGLVTCLVQDPGTAERVSGEAFVDVWRRSATYDPACGGAAAWVLGTVRRLVVPASRTAPRPSFASPQARAHDGSCARPGSPALRRRRAPGLVRRSRPPGIDAELRPEESAAALITGG